MRRLPPLFVAAIALLYVLEARSFDAGFIADPIGPRAFPYVIGILALVASALLLRNPGEPRESLPDAAFGLRAALVVLALLAYVWVLEDIGFVLATTGLMTALIVVFRGPFLVGLGGAFLVSAFVYTLFVYAFSIPLPFGSVFGGT